MEVKQHMFTEINVDTIKIRKLRIKKGWNLREFGRRSNLNVSIISRIESGKSLPTPKTAKAIADTLEIEFDEVFKIV